MGEQGILLYISHKVVESATPFHLYLCHPDLLYDCLFVCLGFYAISTVFQPLNGDSSQIHVFWIIFNYYLISPLSSRSAIPIILSAKGEIHYYQFQRLLPVAAGDGTHDLPLTRRTLLPLGRRGGYF